MSKRSRIILGATLTLAAFCVAHAAAIEPIETLDLWPDVAPGETGDIGPEGLQPPIEGKRKVDRLANVSEPTIAVYKPEAEVDTGAAVVICPGGGYYILAMDLEGTEVAQWLNSIGVTGIVLKYRVPRRKGRPKHEAPLQDAQRAMRLVRANAKRFEIDPERIGILGFSAGGHLSAATATNYDQRAYAPLDQVDETSCRPDFAVLVYPGYLLDETDQTHRTLAPEIRVSSETPPVFFAHAADDRVNPLGSVRMFEALRAAGVQSELHIYGHGGHGFGLRESDDPCSTWPASCEAWMRRIGLLDSGDS